MKIEVYVSMDAKPNEKTFFSIKFSDENSCFDIFGLTEEEVREMVEDIEDQLILYLETNFQLQASISDKNLGRKKNE